MSARGSRRGGGRGGRGGESAAINVLPTTRSVPTYDLFSEEDLVLIEENAEKILSEVGIDFRDDPEVIEIWKNFDGATVEGENVKFEKGILRKTIQATAPKEFVQHARNPERSVTIGGNNVVYVPAYGSPFVRDMEGGRRYGTIADFQNFVKLAYMSEGIHHSGGTICEPVDVPVNKRHLDMVYSHMKYSDKPFMGSVTAPERAQDTIEMCKILFGDDFVDQNCVVVNLINANSPLVFDDTMLAALKVYASNNQASVISPFILSGAMSPVSVMGTLSQILAEVLAGAALTQIIRAGSPVVFGTFSAVTNLQTGAPSFGGPESSQVLFGAGQLARRLGIPFRSGGGLNASKAADAQAGYEAAVTMSNATLAGVNFMLHTAGWLEGGLVMSYEKFIMDADLCAGLCKFKQSADNTPNGLAEGSWNQVGPGNHFLGSEHTNNNFRTAFYNSTISDSNSFEQWVEDGEKTQEMRANDLKNKMLASYTAPALDEEIDAKLQAYVQKVKDSMPDANY